MNLLCLDTETTTFNKGNCYDGRNSLVCCSFVGNSIHSGCVPKSRLGLLREQLDKANLVIGFNFKFDLAWLKKEGLSFEGKQIWDVQIAEFILSSQTNRFPSLNDTCLKYGLGTKLDTVKTEYWDKGIDTTEIPWEILSKYAIVDAEQTLACYHEQIKLMTPLQIQLCYLQCQDLVVLQEMEETGIVFDEALCLKRSTEVLEQAQERREKLASTYPTVPINFASNDHLSAFLYGGVVKEESKEHSGFFKSGAKAGQPKYKNIVIEHSLPRLYQPIKGTEMSKEGNFSTNEDTLRKLKGKPGVIQDILELSKLEKLNGTYYEGLIKLRKEMCWKEGMLHGSFNQTTAQTGRLSSSRPNLQNFATELQDIFVSRYSK
jgi:DNA polymerase I